MQESTSMFASPIPAILFALTGTISSFWGAAAVDNPTLASDPLSAANLQTGGFVALSIAVMWAFLNNRVTTTKRADQALSDYRAVVDRSSAAERAHCDAQVEDLKEQIGDLRVQRNEMLALVAPFVK